MKAEKAIQQKMHRKNSWGDGRQNFEELFKLTLVLVLVLVLVLLNMQGLHDFQYMSSWTKMFHLIIILLLVVCQNLFLVTLPVVFSRT